MRIADLRVLVPPSDLNPRVPTRFVEATVADLIAALEEEGAKVKMMCREHHARYDDGAPGCGVWMAVKEGGGGPLPCDVMPYLVFRIDEEGEKWATN